MCGISNTLASHSSPRPHAERRYAFSWALREWAHEDEIHAGAGPLELAVPAIAPLEHVFGRGGRLPRRTHVEQVHEEIIGERLWPLGEDAVLCPAEVCIEDT